SFSFTHTATSEIYTLSLHDALPILKVPMQFLILLLGAMVFLFYQFEEPPIYFNRPAYDRAIALGHGAELNELQAKFDDVFARKRDRKSTRLNSSHVAISYAVFCLKK